MNGELLELHQHIFIDNDKVTNEYNYNLLNNILSTLGRHHYTLSIEAIDIFCRLEWNYRVNLLSNINKTLYEKSKRNNEEIGIFYVNYPNEVKSQDKRELYINSLLYFYHNFYNNGEGEPIIDRPELTEDIPLAQVEFTTDINFGKETGIQNEPSEQNEELEEVKLDNLDTVISKLQNSSEDELEAAINAIEEGLEERDYKEEVVVIGEDDTLYDQMELFHTDHLPKVEIDEEVDEELEVEEEHVNEDQLSIFDSEENSEDDPYVDQSDTDDIDEELDEEDSDDIDEELDDDDSEDIDEEELDKIDNPYSEDEELDEDDDSEDDYIEQEEHQDVKQYDGLSPEEVQEEIEEISEDFIDLVALDETPSFIPDEEVEVEKKKRVNHIDTLIDNREYLKLLKHLKKEPNELARRIIFILEGINFKYGQKSDRLEHMSKALGIFEGRIDQISYDNLSYLTRVIRNKEEIGIERGIEKVLRELSEIITEEIEDRRE